MSILEFNSSVINSFLLLFITLFLILKSKSWKGPVIEGRVTKIEDTLKNLSRNVKSLENDLLLWKRESDTTNEEIIKELKTNNLVVEEFAEIKDKFIELEIHFTSIDQIATALPCNPCKVIK